MEFALELVRTSNPVPRADVIRLLAAVLHQRVLSENGIMLAMTVSIYVLYGGEFGFAWLGEQSLGQCGALN